jgi:hypothetical protein
MPNKIEIRDPLVLVGEGDGDSAFFRYLCEAHTIEGIQCLSAGGTGNFERFLKDLRSMTGFRLCKTLIVVGDNDDTMDAKFKEIRKYLKRGNLPYPDAPFKLTKNGDNDPSVMVVMLPFDADQKREKGCLETLLLKAVRDHKPEIAECVPNFSACLKINERVTNVSHRDKFFLRAILAAAFPDDPNFGLQYALKPAHNVIPLNHEAFNPIVSLLRKVME